MDGSRFARGGIPECLFQDKSGKMATPFSSTGSNPLQIPVTEGKDQTIQGEHEKQGPGDEFHDASFGKPECSGTICAGV
jgi:hypothetical protein